MLGLGEHIRGGAVHKGQLVASGQRSLDGCLSDEAGAAEYEKVHVSDPSLGPGSRLLDQRPKMFALRERLTLP
jgi:hypothetical protein